MGKEALGLLALQVVRSGWHKLICDTQREAKVFAKWVYDLCTDGAQEQLQSDALPDTTNSSY